MISCWQQSLPRIKESNDSLRKSSKSKSEEFSSSGLTPPPPPSRRLRTSWSYNCGNFYCRDMAKVFSRTQRDVIMRCPIYEVLLIFFGDAEPTANGWSRNSLRHFFYRLIQWRMEVGFSRVSLNVPKDPKCLLKHLRWREKALFNIQVYFTHPQFDKAEIQERECGFVTQK